MSQLTKKQKWIYAICGLILFLSGVRFAVFDDPLISLGGAFFMIWGVYYFIRGTY